VEGRKRWGKKQKEERRRFIEIAFLEENGERLPYIFNLLV